MRADDAKVDPRRGGRQDDQVEAIDPARAVEGSRGGRPPGGTTARRARQLYGNTTGQPSMIGVSVTCGGGGGGVAVAAVAVAVVSHYCLVVHVKTSAKSTKLAAEPAP